MVIKTIFNGMNRSLRGGHFVLWIASGQVVKGRTGSQRMVQESVALRVTYERKKVSLPVEWLNVRPYLHT